MDIASDWFTQYEYHKIYDVPKWYAEIENTEGMVFHTEGTQGYEIPRKALGFTDAIRTELGIADLLVVGDEIVPEEDERAPEPCWYESSSFEEVIRKAENGLDLGHDRRVELLRALE